MEYVDSDPLQGFDMITSGLDVTISELKFNKNYLTFVTPLTPSLAAKNLEVKGKSLVISYDHLNVETEERTRIPLALIDLKHEPRFDSMEMTGGREVTCVSFGAPVRKIQWLAPNPMGL